MIAAQYSATPSVVEALLKAKANMEAKNEVRHLQGHRRVPHVFSLLVGGCSLTEWIYCSAISGEILFNPVSGRGLTEGESQHGSKEQGEAFAGSSARTSCLLIARGWVFVDRTDELL